MKVASTAGPQQAASAVPTTVATATANVARSFGVTSYNSPVISCVDAIAAARPKRDAPERECNPLPHHHRHNLTSRSAERDSDADLLCPLRHCKRDDAVNADDDEQQRRQSECTKQQQGQSARCDRIGQRVVEGFHVEQGLRAVDR